jgi:phage antirepressor YoqD-like protein
MHDNCIIPGRQEDVYTHDGRREKMLLARERMELDFMNIKEEDNCGSKPYCNLA